MLSPTLEWAVDSLKLQTLIHTENTYCLYAQSYLRDEAHGCRSPDREDIRVCRAKGCQFYEGMYDHDRNREKFEACLGIMCQITNI